MKPIPWGRCFYGFNPAIFMFMIFTAPPALTQPSVINNGPLQFEHLTIDDGLSQSFVTAIHQDSKGFLWFGTDDGLNRYDGFSFRVFYNDPNDSTSISMNSVTAIAEDYRGNLWIGTRQGLNIYNPVTERFRRIAGDSTVLTDDRISALYCDADSSIWIGTDSGLNRIPASMIAADTIFGLQAWRHEPEYGGSIGQGRIWDIFRDGRGRLWIASYGGGLNLVKRDRTGRIYFKQYLHDPADPASISSNLCTGVCEDVNGNLWIATFGGLNRIIESETLSFQRFLPRPADPHAVADNAIRTLFCDHQGNLWIGTQHCGLDRVTPEETKAHHPRFLHHPNEAGNPNSVSASDVLCLNEDRSGVLWIGTYGGAVTKLVLDRNFFPGYLNTSPYAINNNHQRIWTLREDHIGTIWVGTDGGGIYLVDRETGQFTPFSVHALDPQMPVLLYVAALFEDSQHRIWIGAYGQGVFIYDRENRHRPIQRLFTGTDSLRSVLSFAEDDNRNIWIGGFEGLYRWQRESGRIDKFNHDPDTPASLSEDRIYTVCSDMQGNLWIGTSGGGVNLLSKQEMDSDQPVFIHYRENRESKQTIASDYILSLYADDSGRLWIGTHGRGVSCLDIASKQIITYSESDGLASNSVVGILTDDLDAVWFSTLYGLSRLEESTGTFRNFYRSEGLQSNEFNRGAAFKNREGQLYFGGISGFNIIDPAAVSMNDIAPEIAITDFQIFNRPIVIDPEQRVYPHLPKAPAYSDTVMLSYSDDTISLEFAALHFVRPLKNQYAYMMSGIDRDWVYSGNRHFVTYSPLPPGAYTFRVKAANSDGVWNEEGITLYIKIIPPFWKTPWFRIVLFAIAALLLFNALYKRIRMAAEKRRELEERVKEKTEAAEKLQSALDQVEQLKDRLQAENTYLQGEINLDHNFANIITKNRRLREILGQIEKVASTDSTVLILGESGTGKELLARAIHSISSRKDRPLVKVDCAALPGNLIESELFGHEKGAFTGAHARKTGRLELADGGTVFLDEIGELPLELQAKLLRFLQDGVIERVGNPQPIDVDVRTISATNRDLARGIKVGTFREDLYYRLNVFPITIPPLRERKEDIPLLVSYFCSKYSAKFGKVCGAVPKSVIDTLTAYPWPGNIRELENVIERAVILSQDGTLRPGELFAASVTAGADSTRITTLEENERAYIVRVLEMTGWRVSGERGAAKILGIKPTTLASRMQKLGITRK
ncbi:sigma 54-interacting transcriptional regulator [bacterium]|nr:sigma 54-interacting transcriptional regulator [bacterium]